MKEVYDGSGEGRMHCRDRRTTLEGSQQALLSQCLDDGANVGVIVPKDTKDVGDLGCRNLARSRVDISTHRVIFSGAMAMVQDAEERTVQKYD